MSSHCFVFQGPSTQVTQHGQPLSHSVKSIDKWAVNRKRERFNVYMPKARIAPNAGNDGLFNLDLQLSAWNEARGALSNPRRAGQAGHAGMETYTVQVNPAYFLQK